MESAVARSARREALTRAVICGMRERASSSLGCFRSLLASSLCGLTAIAWKPQRRGPEGGTFARETRLWLLLRRASSSASRLAARARSTASSRRASSNAASASAATGGGEPERRPRLRAESSAMSRAARRVGALGGPTQRPGSTARYGHKPGAQVGVAFSLYGSL